MVESDQWVAHTFGGEIDYYNLKPPLNIWLIATAFKTLGTNLVALRLASVVSAWLTVLVLLLWARRQFGDGPALLTALVLSTCFAPVYVHAGKSGNPDAPFALCVVLMVVAASAARTSPWSRAWFGPIAAAAFMLKGTAALLPLAIAAAAELLPPRARPERWRTMAVAALLFAVPVGAWALARWRVDGWLFLGPLVGQDFVARAGEALDDHAGPPYYYLNILQMYHYDWLIAGAAAFAAVWRWRGLRALRQELASFGAIGLVGVWAAVAFLVPTVMQTKLPWYLNPFYPAFAVGIALLVWTAWRAAGGAESAPARRRLLAGVLVLALGVAEGRLVYYSYDRRDVGPSLQGILMEHADSLAGGRVFSVGWTHADWFVAAAIAGVDPVELAEFEAFWQHSQPGDHLLTKEPLLDARLELVRRNRSGALYVRPR
jgi:4-amino-4-deoxy-L-arabinose transferase-like glycosyltransferase